MGILASGTCGADGANVTWELTDDYTLIFSGSGAMTDEYNNYLNQPWSSYRRNITSVIVSDGVTSIGDCMCQDFSSLTSVAISNSVTKIGHSTFRDCTALISIEIPENVTVVNKNAFKGCTALTRVEFLGDAPSTVYGIDSTPSFESTTTIYYNGDKSGWTLDSDGTWNGYTAVEVIIESETIITESKHYKSIAKAIRAKNGTTATYKPSEMAAAIRSISTGSTGVELPTLTTPASASHVLYGKQFINQDGAVVTGTIQSVAGQIITPSASEKTAVESDKYTTGTIFIAGDSNLVPENIRSGVSIFNVDGSYNGSSGTLKMVEATHTEYDCFDTYSFSLGSDNALSDWSAIFITAMDSLGAESYSYMSSFYVIYTTEGIINGHTCWYEGDEYEYAEVNYDSSFALCDVELSADGTEVIVSIDDTVENYFHPTCGYKLVIIGTPK